MKIALMLRNLGEKGGINVYTMNVVLNLLNIDHNNDYLILYKDENQMGTFSDFKNVKEFLIKAPNKLIWDQVNVPRFLANKHVDLVFNPKHTVSILGKWKKTMVIHGAEQFEVKSAFAILNRIYTRLTMPMYARNSDIVITTTNTGIVDLSRHLKLQKNRFRYVYEGAHDRFKRLDKDLCFKIRDKYNLPEKFILFVGGLTPLKNFDRIIKAFEKLNNVHSHSLVFVGFKRFKFKNDLSIVSDLIKENKVIFPGFVSDDDLPSFYNLAELLIFPSLYEGFGLPALEAMSCGCPVVTSTKGCTREVTGDAAILVDPYDIDDIYKGMCRVIEDSDLRDNMIKKGLGRSRDFSWKKTAQGILNIFGEIMSV